MATPVHICLLRGESRTNCFMSATKTMQPPRSIIHTDAGMYIRPAIRRSTDERSKTAGTARPRTMFAVTFGSASSAACATASPRARRRLTASMPRYIGSAKHMPKNMMKVSKTGGRNGSISPVEPRAVQLKSAFAAAMQIVPATTATMKTIADCVLHVGSTFPPPMTR